MNRSGFDGDIEDPERFTGLYTWLRRIGLKREQARRTEHGDYLARGRLHGARVALIAHAHSYN